MCVCIQSNADLQQLQKFKHSIKAAQDFTVDDFLLNPCLRWRLQIVCIFSTAFSSYDGLLFQMKSSKTEDGSSKKGSSDAVKKSDSSKVQNKHNLFMLFCL